MYPAQHLGASLQSAIKTIQSLEELEGLRPTLIAINHKLHELADKAGEHSNEVYGLLHTLPDLVYEYERLPVRYRLEMKVLSTGLHGEEYTPRELLHVRLKEMLETLHDFEATLNKTRITGFLTQIETVKNRQAPVYKVENGQLELEKEVPEIKFSNYFKYEDFARQKDNVLLENEVLPEVVTPIQKNSAIPQSSIACHISNSTNEYTRYHSGDEKQNVVDVLSVVLNLFSLIMLIILCVGVFSAFDNSPPTQHNVSSKNK